MRILNNSILETADISEVGITDGMIGWWPLNGNTRDLSGEKYDATPSTNITMEQGPKGLAYSLGLEKSITINNSSIRMNDIINAYNGVTLSIYFKSKGNAHNDAIIFGGNGLNWGLLTYSDGRVQLSFYSDSGDGVKTSYKASTTIPLNEWVHVVGSFDKTTQTIKIYINGIFKTQTIMLKPIWFNSDVLRFGSSSTSYWVDGLISDARIYNRVLSDEEIGILYKSTGGSNGIEILNNKIYLNGIIKEV